jgi:secreted PhoX family phosphatase
MTGKSGRPTGSGFERRTLLRGAAVAAAASVPFQALAARTAAAAPAKFEFDAGYGPLSPVQDQATGLELLQLPRGFEYISYGWTNDLMDDGVRTPGSHDGMAAFRYDDKVHIVRNHERGAGPAFTAPAYNPEAGGGTTTMVFDPDAGQWLESYGSLGGTIRNCAGGPTPWNTWLTCEETFSTTAGKRHGYIFEVASEGKGNPQPYTAMGRFNHEAVAGSTATPRCTGSFRRSRATWPRAAGSRPCASAPRRTTPASTARGPTAPSPGCPWTTSTRRRTPCGSRHRPTGPPYSAAWRAPGTATTAST